MKNNKIKNSGHGLEGEYVPETEIVIHIGEKGECTTLDRMRVYINGEKINNLQGFEFKGNIGTPPEITIRKYLYKN